MMRSKWVALIVVASLAMVLTLPWTSKPASAATLSNPVTAQNCDGRYEQFGVSGNQLFHRWQETPNGTWSAWNSLGGYLVYDALAVSQNVDCRLEVFGVGGDYAMWHIWQTTAGGGWSNWASLGDNEGWFSSGVVKGALTANGGLVIFAWANGGASYVCDYERGRAAGPWSTWLPASVCHPGMSV
jgi:hypothetical protein